MQKAIITTGYWDKKGTWNDTTEDLNKLLSEGWEVVSISPMGAFGYGYSYGNSKFTELNHFSESDNGFASLVVIEKM